MDSDEEGENEPLSLTGFLFGNIDESGQLENDFLDLDSKRNLHQLNNLGIDSLLKEITEDIDASTRDSQDSEGVETQSSQSDDETGQNSPVVVDYSDINELADEVDEPNKSTLFGNKVTELDDNEDYDADEEDNLFLKDNQQSDKELMPPPPIPPPWTPTSSGVSSLTTNNNAVILGTTESDSYSPEKKQKKLDTPLAAMLPSKYADLDVTELFPEFRPGKVLCFSRLFGPGKPSSLPQIWRGVKSRKKKRQQNEGEQSRQVKPTKGLEFACGSPPSADMVGSDDELRLIQPEEQKGLSSKGESHKPTDMTPGVADWRYGPAQLWYDMLNVPETGEEFDYGFRLKESEEEDDQEETSNKDGEVYPSDAYLMVTQLQWEEDVIWNVNGEDMKQKVMAKINSKSNAAGWVPSNSNRTASAFSQQSKNVTSSAGGGTTQKQGPQSSSKSSMKGSQQNFNKLDGSEEREDTGYSIFPVENEELVYGSWEDDVIWDAQAVDKVPEPKILTLDPNDENIILGIPDDPDPSDATTSEPVKEKKDMVRKSRILLGKAGVIAEPEPPSPPPPQNVEKDPFNISNDQYYNPKMTQDSALKPNVGGNLIQAGGSSGLLMDLAANEKSVHAEFYNSFDDLFDDDDLE